MINIIVWCMLTVGLNGETIETAVQGKVTGVNRDQYGDKVLVVDFSQYAEQKGYTGTFKNHEIPEYLCTTEGKN